MNHEIRLYGPIGGMFGIDADQIIGEIPKDATEITVRIHSPGGSVGDGLALFHALSDHAANVVTIVDGYAASAASFVMLAGDEVRVHRNSIIMVHNPWTVAEGNSGDLRRTADALDVHTDAIVDIYKRKTGKTEEELKDLMDDETYFRGIDAKDMGFADTVLDDYEEEQAIAAMLRVEQVLARIQTEEKNMTTKTRKEIAAELEASQASLAEFQGKVTDLESAIEQAQADATAQVEALQTEHAGQVEALNADIEATKSELEAKVGELTQASEQLTAARAALADAEAQAEEQAGKLMDQAKEIETLNAKLTNPAFAHVASEGQEPVADGGEGGDSGQTAHMDAYMAISDPVAKTRYWNDNKAAIEAEMKQASSK